MSDNLNEKKERRQSADEYIEQSLQRLREGNLKQAEKMLLRAKDIYEEIDDKRQLAYTLNMLSITYDEMGNDRDTDMLLDAVDISLDEEADDLAAKYINNIGSKFMSVKAYDRAMIYFERALELYDSACRKGLCERENSQTFELILGLNLAAVYCIKGDLVKAEKYYKQAEKSVAHPSNEEFVLSFKAFESLMLWRLGKTAEAEACVDPIIHMLKEDEYTTDYVEIMDNLIELVSEMKAYDKWEEMLKIMETHIDSGINKRVEMVQHWLQYYEACGDEENYRRACVDYYKLSKEKSALDFEQAADNLDMKIEMRRAAKQKQVADTMIYSDTLTGTGSRNRMLEDSRVYIAESIEKHTPITIGLIDIDFFKECNDTYGHIRGDECLKKVAAVLKKAVGEKGNVYRYGGDEFLLLLPEISVEDVLAIGKEIKENVDKECIANEKSPISPYVTVSQGYTSAYAEENDTIDQLVNLADRVLYSVKRRGRNNYKYMSIREIREIR